MNNRAGEMEAFVQVADLGGFSAAGRRLGLSPSAVSKLVSRMEERLGTRLLVRSTRRLSLTLEGESYLARARIILAQIEETEREVAQGANAAPRGRLRVSASVPFGMHCITPLIPEFLQRYPGVQVDLSLSDEVIDLIGERADVAIRVGPLRDSTLMARRLAESRYEVVASPDYLVRSGAPQLPADLVRHNCLGFTFRRIIADWPFRIVNENGGDWIERHAVSGNFNANNGETARQMAVAGLGIARLASFHVAADIAAGRLVRVLPSFNPGDIEAVHAVFVGHAQLAARLRAFVDFLAEALPRSFSAPG
jgi:DNA-binding transcriptional LysR family regulator